MKQIKSYKGLKKGDILYYTGKYRGEKEEGYSVVNIIVITDEKPYLYETHIHTIKSPFVEEGSHRHSEDNLLNFNFYKLNEKEIKKLKLKITVASL